MECMKDAFRRGQMLDGKYRTVAPLNHGSFGIVFLAEDPSGTEVAIKCSVKNQGEDEELYCHQTLQHKNLVNMVDHFESPAHTYLALEYCSQGDLYEAIRLGRGPRETEHVRDFMLQLVDAVEHMHSHGLSHRDIKPENIFLTSDGSMKLGDFGLASKASVCFESCVGSDRYMAPEQYEPSITGYSPAKADIWSIGVCLLNVLFSRNPFTMPTESDLLFADFRRDRQSLFDVFPNMSQDTFEILTHALALDPEKRSLDAVREAILRCVSFTNNDESLDDFCTEERNTVRASANREPLRTPSLQSPALNNSDSFPWAKVLHATPKRQLSAIPDTELYDEDLFPGSEGRPGSWYSIPQNTPSLASVLDSGLGASFMSMAIRRPVKQPKVSGSMPAISGSLPAPTLAKPISMSTVFGKKEDVSKSWSDLWDEEAEEEMEEMRLRQRQELNARSFSHNSDDVTVRMESRPGVLGEKSHSSTNIPRMLDFKVSKPIGMDENFDRRPRTKHSFKSSDKWAALGDKRRGTPAPVTKTESVPAKRARTKSWRRDGELLEAPKRGSRSIHPRPVWLDQDWRREQHPLSAHKPEFGGDEESQWVGGWNAFH